MLGLRRGVYERAESQAGTRFSFKDRWKHQPAEQPEMRFDYCGRRIRLLWGHYKIFRRSSGGAKTPPTERFRFVYSAKPLSPATYSTPQGI